MGVGARCSAFDIKQSGSQGKQQHSMLGPLGDAPYIWGFAAGLGGDASDLRRLDLTLPWVGLRGVA